jgi:hypothetical protein
MKEGGGALPHRRTAMEMEVTAVVLYLALREKGERTRMGARVFT